MVKEPENFIHFIQGLQKTRVGQDLAAVEVANKFEANKANLGSSFLVVVASIEMATTNTLVEDNRAAKAASSFQAIATN